MMKGISIKSRLSALLVAVAFVITGCMALSFMFIDAAYADEETFYEENATATSEQLKTMPGVYRVKVGMNNEANPKTIGIPSVSKENLTNRATKEMPAIIMGAAVNYEVRTGPIDFTPIDDAKLLPPYSYFRYKYMEKEEQGADGQITKIRTITGFDQSYYIVRVDVSNIIADAEAKARKEAEDAGESIPEGTDLLDGKYLHVRQENNKALLVATGLTKNSFVWNDTSQENNKGGCKAASYPLANNAEAMKDETGSDMGTPYLDVILLSSAKNVAGADVGAETAPVANIDLSFYVDDTSNYVPWLTSMLDPNNKPTKENPLIITYEGVEHKYEDEASYNADLAKKFFDEDKAFDKESKLPIEANSATKYRIMGEDLEIDVGIDVNAESYEEGEDSQGIDWMSENMDFWSMEKAIAHNNYDNHTIIMICEVPVLDGLSISGTKERSVVLDVNSFDIQIANNTEEGRAELIIGNNATLRIKDGSNTAGAELAVGNNAIMVIENGGTMIIDETCTTEAEFDAASTAEPSQDQSTLLSGEITVKEGGMLINHGVINIEGTEGKPIDPTVPEPIIRDKQSADILVEYGGLLDNYGCISLKGTLHILGNLNNYGRFDDILRTNDPDKGSVDYHRGIQITWKDDVRQEGVVPGALYIGIDAQGNIEKKAVLYNYGDIVLVPGTIDLYGTLNNLKHPDEDIDYAGHLYLCTVNEAIIPVENSASQSAEASANPTVVEERVALDPPIESVFNRGNGGVFNNEEGVMWRAKVELISNGVLGKLTPLSEDEVISKQQEAVAAAEAEVESARTAMDELLKTDNPSTEEIDKAYQAVVKAQNALADAEALLSAAEQVKIQNLNQQVEEMTQQLADLTVVDISNYAATLKKTSYEYTGKEIKPAVTVSGLTAEDYTVTYSNNKAIGKATVTITGKEDRNFKGKIVKTFQITKRTNTLKVKAKTATLKAKVLKKKQQTLKVAKVIKVTKKGQGKLTYAKASGNKKITINKKNGKVTVKKGLKKGTYKVKVKVKAAGNKTYKAVAKAVTFKIVVK